MRWLVPLLLCSLVPSLAAASVDSDGDGLTDDYETGYGRYQFIEGFFSWEQAKADAEARGGHLGTITSAQEHEFLRANFSGYANGSLQPWLGASETPDNGVSNGVWNWVTGELWIYTRWTHNNPSIGGNQNYLWSGYAPNLLNPIRPPEVESDQLWDDIAVGPHPPSGSWQGINCYLLEFGYPTDPLKADTDGDGFNDKTESDSGYDPNNPSSSPPADAVTLAAGTTLVEVVQGSYSWDQARIDAAKRGGRLAVLPTAEVHDRVVTAARASYQDGFWLGASDQGQEGVWRWLDGTLLSYERWRAGEPNNNAGDEDALEVMVGGFGWIDLSQHEPRSYLLEKVAVSLLALETVAEGSPWAVDYSVAHDDFSSAKAQTADGQSTHREYKVTGPAVLDFWWKVSSEKDFDKFFYSLNGVVQETISGQIDWSYRTLTLPAGVHTIRWTYAKDGSDAVGQDAGWLDELAVYPATATLKVRDGAKMLTGTTNVDFGSSALQGSSPTKTLTFANEGYVPLEVQLSLPSGSPFSVQDDGGTFELLLGRGESADVPIQLSTSSAGTKTAQLSITAASSTVAPPTVTLRGVLLGQKIGVAQGGNSLESGQSIDMGLAPRTLQFAIGNTGNVGNLVISGVSVTGNFQITQQPQTSIAPQTSTTFTVLARATAFGNQTGSITINSNDPDTPTFTIPLTAKSLAVNGEGIRSDSMATFGNGGAVGWDLGTTVLPSGQSGNAIKTGATPNNGISTLEFTTQTAGVVSWSWKVSAQQDFDWLLCEVNGQEVAGISTKNGVWQTQVVNVPAGANVRWVYRKDATASAGEDAGYLADVEFRSFAANQPFGRWADTHGIYDQQQRLPKSGMQAMFGWLGGFTPAVGPSAGHHAPTMEGGRLKYIFPISKTADGTQQILYSSDMTSWTPRRFSQRIVSEDADGLVVEAFAPNGLKGFFKVVGTVDPSMVWVSGGMLPETSALTGATVAAFQIGRTEVTWREWRDVRDWAVANGYDAAEVGQGSGPEHPVHSVSWYDAVKWCNAKSEKEGLRPVYWLGGKIFRAGQGELIVDDVANGYRLPTEAEWEWAARGGIRSQGFTYSGSNDLNLVAWYWDNSGGSEVILNAGRGTWPVDSKAANEIGTHDQSGNVSEWTSDAIGLNRRIRGGNWLDWRWYCSLSHRDGANGYPNGYSADGRHTVIGFRVARNAED